MAPLLGKIDTVDHVDLVDGVLRERSSACFGLIESKMNAVETELESFPLVVFILLHLKH